MTKDELKQYRSIVAEIDELTERIRDNTVRDTVRGSDSQYPYTQHAMSVSGVAPSHRKELLRCKQLQRRRNRIRKWVADIPDSLTRRIFRYKYIDGTVEPSWQWVAFKVGGNNKAESVRKRAYRYLIKK